MENDLVQKIAKTDGGESSAGEPAAPPQKIFLRDGNNNIVQVHE